MIVNKLLILAQTCPLPFLPDNARIANNNTLNTIVKSNSKQYKFSASMLIIYSCLPGYMLTGSDFVICQSNGQWSPLKTKCISFCRFPGYIEYGRTTTTPRDYYLKGEKIIYYCTENGFKLASDNLLECLEGGEWSKRKPKCVSDINIKFLN